VTISAFTVAGAGLLAVGRHEQFGWTLVGLAGAQWLFHVLGDLKRKYHKGR
jgi:hypothetical protein